MHDRTKQAEPVGERPLVLRARPPLRSSGTSGSVDDLWCHLSPCHS